MHRAALAFSASLDLGDVIHSVLEEAQAILAAGSWSVWLLDEAGTTLTCWQADGPGGDVLRGYQITLDQGVVGWAVRNNTRVYVKNLRRDPRRDDRIAARSQMPAVSLICCPLNVSSRETGTVTTIGTINLASDRIDGFSRSDVALVDVLSASAATAIQNARLYERSQRELETRRLIEGALRESESHYRTLIETSPNSIFLLALDGKILMCNHRMLALDGYERPTDVLGKSFLAPVAPEDRAEAQDMVTHVPQGHTLRDRELTLVRSDGTPFAGELGAALTADSRGEPAGIVIFARDISDRKEAEAAVHRHNLELRVLPNEIPATPSISKHAQVSAISSSERRLNLMNNPVLIAETRVNVPVDFATAWFLALADHPGRYAFESHAGFVFTQGEFGEPGARFQTEEGFAGFVKLVLKFELVEVEDHRFIFKVLSPTPDIWGYFELEPTSQNTTHLRLAVGSDRSFRRRLLGLPLVRGAIQHQIEGEVAHISKSMTSLYQAGEE